MSINQAVDKILCPKVTCQFAGLICANHISLFVDKKVTYVIFCITYSVLNGFGGLGVACWPLIPKFAGSNPAEAVGFLGRKNPQHAFLRRGSKAVGPMS